MSNTKLPAQANWVERFEELLEDYAGARAEVAHFNATQQSGMKVRLPRPRLKALMDHVADRERQAGEAVAYINQHGVIHEAGYSWGAGNDLTPLFASLPAPQAVQAGWKLVPVEPTEDMLFAAEMSELRGYRALYRAMTIAAPSPDVKAEQAEAPSDAAREVFAAGIVHHYGVPEEASFACARRVLALASKPTASPEQAEAPSDADPLTPEQEEWVMDLAEKHNLGRRVPQIGAMRGVAPDVFYTDASYRTHELFCFAAALLSTKELT